MSWVPASGVTFVSANMFPAEPDVGQDYPHPESTFPKSEEITTRLLAEIPDIEREMILAGNIARIFGMSYSGTA
jgi:hypothetical protein